MLSTYRIPNPLILQRSFERHSSSRSSLGYASLRRHLLTLIESIQMPLAVIIAHRLPRNRMIVFRFLVVVIWLSISSSTTYAHAAYKGQPTQAMSRAEDILQGYALTSNLPLLTTLGLLTLLPFAVMMLTSFVKVSVVLSIMRSAIGTPQIPPAPVITGLSLLLSLYIMSPVCMTIYQQAHPVIRAMETNGVTSKRLVHIIRAIQEPVRSFLQRHVHQREQNMFYKLAKRLQQQGPQEDLHSSDFLVLVPAFLISELKEAFQIGFILFVPFLVVDLIVANILMALGMQMLSPTTISLPFKLLLFVMIDGWLLVTKGLIIGYLS